VQQRVGQVGVAVFGEDWAQQRDPGEPGGEVPVAGLDVGDQVGYGGGYQPFDDSRVAGR
jgi:hypothetical protein